MKIIIFLVLSLAALAHQNDLPRQLEEVQNKVQQTGVPANACCEFTKPSTNYVNKETLSQACTRSVCGTAMQMQPYGVHLAEAIDRFSARGNTPLPEKISRLLLQKDTDEDKLNEYIQNIAKTAQLDPNQSVPKSFNRLLFFLKALQFKNEAIRNNRSEVDLAQTKAYLEKRGVKDAELISKSLVYMDKLALGMEGVVVSLPPEKLLAKIFPDKSLKQAVETLNTELSKSTENLKENHKGIYAFIASSLEERPAGEPKDEDQLRKLITTYMTARVLNGVVGESADNPFLLSPPSKVKDLLISKSAYQNQAPTPQDFLSRCEHIYNLNKEILPDKNQVEQLLKQTEEVKKEFINKFPVNYSEQTTKLLAERVKKLEFVLPPTFEDFEKELFAQAGQSARIMRNTMQVIKEAPVEELALVGMLRASHGNVARQSICENYTYDGTLDQTSTPFGGVGLSFFTATRPAAYQKIIIAHEIGHNISAALEGSGASQHSLKKFRASQACLEDMHKEAMPPASQIMHKNNGSKAGFYVKEDYADAVAFAVTDRATKNPWCYLMDSSFGIYADTKFTASDGDVHSSNLFRLMHFEYGRQGKLSAECEQLMQATPDRPEFKKCL